MPMDLGSHLIFMGIFVGLIAAAGMLFITTKNRRGYGRFAKAHGVDRD